MSDELETAVMNHERRCCLRSSLITHYSSLGVLNRFSALLKHLAVPDKAGARIGGQLKVLGQLETISWAGLLTKSAEHAARCIEDELVENFFAARFAGHHDFDVHGNNVDAIFRTGQRAKITGNAQRVVCFRIHV